MFKEIQVTGRAMDKVMGKDTVKDMAKEFMGQATAKGMGMARDMDKAMVKVILLLTMEDILSLRFIKISLLLNTETPIQCTTAHQLAVTTHMGIHTIKAIIHTDLKTLTVNFDVLFVCMF